MSKCIIFAAGEIKDFSKPLEIISKGDFVICADNGRRHAERLGIKPDIIIGDFDSSVPVSGENVIRLPAEKDDTDTSAALKEGLSRGYKDFRIFGALGGRLDHTAANISLLSLLLDGGAHGTITGDDAEIIMIKNSSVSVKKNGYRYMSVFAYGGNAVGVTLEGVKYPLNDYTMQSSFPIGVSNEISGCEARVSVKDGRLLIMQTND